MAERRYFLSQKAVSKMLDKVLNKYAFYSKHLLVQKSTLDTVEKGVKI